MSTQLDLILKKTQNTVAAAKKMVSLAELERRAEAHRPRGWAAALRKKAATGPAVIAEIKKASPSKGLIRPEFDVEWIARRYKSGGAAALSVLTDEPWFQGSLRNLELASAATPLPCLRKDFMIDEYQVVEARAHRADAILLIAAALTDAEMKHLAEVAAGFSLDVLVEVHTRGELDRVLQSLGTELVSAIGVNNRDLAIFKTDLALSERLIPRFPRDVIAVSESGIHNGTDATRVRAAGAQAVLVGEALMRAPDPAALVADFRRA